MTAALMLPADLQETNEYRFSRKHIDKYLTKHIRETPELEAKVQHGVALLEAWLEPEYYPQKRARLDQLNELELEGLVREIFTGIAYVPEETLFVSVTAQLACRMGFADHRDSILTIAEIVAVLCGTDAFDITKEDRDASMMLQSTMHLPDELIDAIERSLYMPPMVSEPMDVTSNFESPFLTFNDSLILGKGNGHLGDICLDVINTQNKVALKLDTEFLSTVEEEPTHELDTVDKVQQWKQFKYQSYCVYNLIATQGNKFYLPNKYDKRGRKYAQGYHITTQGSPFKKAMIELHNEELIEGVPA
jgi:hypothetical protein